MSGIARTLWVRCSRGGQIESRRSVQTTMEINYRIERSPCCFLVVGVEPNDSHTLRPLATAAVLWDALIRRCGVPLHIAGRAGRGCEPGEWSVIASPWWREGYARCQAAGGVAQGCT